MQLKFLLVISVVQRSSEWDTNETKEVSHHDRKSNYIHSSKYFNYLNFESIFKNWQSKVRIIIFSGSLIGIQLKKHGTEEPDIFKVTLLPWTILDALRCFSKLICCLIQTGLHSAVCALYRRL